MATSVKKVDLDSNRTTLVPLGLTFNLTIQGYRTYMT